MFIRKLTTGLATAALLGSVMAPAAMAADVTVADNGFGSKNEVEIKHENSTYVEQSNTTVAKTVVVASSNSGGNNIVGNTGGSSSVESGEAKTVVSTVVAGGNNKVSLPEGCGCPDGDKVDVKHNGAFSKNEVEIKHENSTKVKQHGFTSAFTYVDADSNSGDNDIKWNTGKHSSSSIKTKKSTTKVDTTVLGGNNTSH